MFVTDSARPDLGGNIRHGDAWTYCPAVWDYLIGRFAVSSMLDVGCGEGHAVKYFQRRGVLAHGIDGLWANIERAVTPIAQHDFTRGWYTMPVNLVWSCEVAEHIAPEHVCNYLDTLANGNVLAMTHAEPGQAGHHHVNCQRADYWIHKLEPYGYTLAEADTNRARALAVSEFKNSHFGRGLIFVKLPTKG